MTSTPGGDWKTQGPSLEGMAGAENAWGLACSLMVQGTETLGAPCSVTVLAQVQCFENLECRNPGQCGGRRKHMPCLCLSSLRRMCSSVALLGCVFQLQSLPERQEVRKQAACGPQTHSVSTSASSSCINCTHKLELSESEEP